MQAWISPYTLRFASDVVFRGLPHCQRSACQTSCGACIFRLFLREDLAGREERKAEPCDDKAGPVWLGARDLGLVSALLYGSQQILGSLTSTPEIPSLGPNARQRKYRRGPRSKL